MREESTTYTTQSVRVAVVRKRMTCDRCGYSVLDSEEEFSEIVLAIDETLCVYSRHIKDYCTDCASEIWRKLCEVIGADPEMTGDNTE